MKIAVVLDPAHGKDTAGKRSPDGLHREYLWSRERIANIVDNVLKEDIKFNLYYPLLYEENEIGLTNRVKKYNDIAKDYDFTFGLSIHNDAYGKGWSSPNGTSVWTSRGDTKADNYATSLFNHLQNVYPNDKFRSAWWMSKGELTRDPDWEADFTILAGNNYVKPLYHMILLERLFQTNKEDVKKLSSKVHNEYFEDMISNWLVTTFNNTLL